MIEEDGFDKEFVDELDEDDLMVTEMTLTTIGKVPRIGIKQKSGQYFVCNKELRKALNVIYVRPGRFGIFVRYKEEKEDE